MSPTSAASQPSVFFPLRFSVMVRALAVLVMVVSGSVAIPASASAQTHPSSYDTPTPDYPGARTMVDLVNEHRRVNGAKALIHDEAFSDRTEPYGLGLASQFPPPVPPAGWAFACPGVTYEDGFKHDTSRSIWASMPAGATTWGENIAYRCGPDFDASVVGAFEALSRSPGHNANMLNPEFTHIGLSVVHFGNSTFVVQRFAKVPGTETVIQSKPPQVRATASCLAGRGRVDTTVTNPNSTTLTYAVRVTGTRGFATTRYVDVPAGRARRVTVTGRYDGTHDISVRPKLEPGATAVTASVEVDCANGELSRPVVVTDSCLEGNGRIDVHVANNTTTTKTYVVDVQSGSVSDRSLTLAAGEKGRVTVTGRPDGDVPVNVMLGGALIHRTVSDVACD